MRRTLAAMGLRHHQAVIERTMSPQLRGQIKHVRHLLEVTTLAKSAQADKQDKPAKKVKASNG